MDDKTLNLKFKIILSNTEDLRNKYEKMTERLEEHVIKSCWRQIFKRLAKMLTS